MPLYKTMIPLGERGSLEGLGTDSKKIPHILAWKKLFHSWIFLFDKTFYHFLYLSEGNKCMFFIVLTKMGQNTNVHLFPSPRCITYTLNLYKT